MNIVTNPNKLRGIESRIKGHRGRTGAGRAGNVTSGVCGL